MADLHAAAKEGDTSTIIQAIGRGDDINVRDKHQRTPLHLAAWAGQTDVVKLLLAKEGCGLNAAAMDDVNALHFAAQKGHTEILRLLINAGLHVNARTRKGVTALHFAAQNGHLEAVKFLLSRKANIEATTAKQQTAYQLAKGQEIKTVLEAAREEAAARLSAAAEDRLDNESRRQRNAQRKRAKKSRAEREEELEVAEEDAAGTDNTDATTIGPMPPAPSMQKASAGSEGKGTTGRPSEEEAGIGGAPDAAVQPAGQHTGLNKSTAKSPQHAVYQSESRDQETNDNHTGDDSSFRGKDDDASDMMDDGLATGAAIGPIGPPTGYKRKSADDTAPGEHIASQSRISAAAPASHKYAGKVVDARMVLSFMGDDEDED